MEVRKTKAIFLLSCLVTLSIVSYIHRNPAGDDGWFAEQAYWLYKDGFVHSNFFKGVLGWDTQLFVSHKFFLFLNSCFIYLFGSKLPVFQTFGLIFFYTLVCQLLIYVAKKEKSYNSQYVLGLLMIVYSNYYLIKTSFESRPEFILAVLGFASFTTLQNKDLNIMRSALSGFMSGLATLTHLNGIIFIIAGFCTLIYCRQYKFAIAFSILSLITSLFYFADIVQVNDGFSTWTYQFRNDPATQKTFTWYSKFILLLTFPKFFFLSPQQAVYSTGFLYIVFNLKDHITNVPRIIRIYCAFLTGSFWIITKSLTVVYMPIFFPFIFICLYELYRLRPIKHTVLKWLCMVYICAGVYGIGEMIYQNYSRGYLPTLYNNLLKDLPVDKVGLVPLSFFFNNYEKFNELVSYDSYKFYTGFNHIKASPHHFEIGRAHV